MNLLVLLLDLEVKLQPKDIAFTIHYLVKRILNCAIASFLRHTGCPFRSDCTEAEREATVP